MNELKCNSDITLQLMVKVMMGDVQKISHALHLTIISLY